MTLVLMYGLFFDSSVMVMCMCCFFFLFFCLFFFCFQAEDGIRDLVRSRGLGDVYKRQVWDPAYVLSVIKDRDARIGACADVGHWATSDITPVSYTHLTLPTSDLV